MGKLTWTHYGLMLLAGVIVSACAQEAREPVEVGIAQVELHSDLVLPETSGSPTEPGRIEDPMPLPRRITLPELGSNSQDRTYRAVNRYEFLPVKPDALKRSVQESIAEARSWTLTDKHGVRAGKGFGVEAMAASGSVHLDDASFYAPAVDLKSYSQVSEHLEPTVEPFKSLKPLIFHRRATGFAHKIPEGQTYPEPPVVSEKGWTLSPIPETRVYLSSKPRIQVTLTPSNNRLDLMYGNQNIIRDRFDNLH